MEIAYDTENEHEISDDASVVCFRYEFLGGVAMRRFVMKTMGVMFVWWILFYPDLVLVKDVCSVVKCDNINTEFTKGPSEVSPKEFANADPDDIEIRCKAWDVLQELVKKK